MSKVTLTLEENRDDMSVTLDLREVARDTKAGRLANELNAVVVQRLIFDRYPRCYQHPAPDTIH